MAKNFPVLFGGIIAYVLLILYVGTVAYMIKSVVQRGVAEAPRDADGRVVARAKLEFAPGFIYVVTTVGGLIWALVVAKLAVTQPGENPTVIREVADIGEQVRNLTQYLTAGYMLAWLATGFAALLVGVLLFPNLNDTLGEIGTTWLGLAIASGYAYFGLSPNR